MDLAVDINESGDLIFDNGATPVKTNEADVVAQRIAIRLRTFKSEWFLDTPYGIPWFDILGTKKTVSQIDHILQRAVLSVEGVREITSWKGEIHTNRNYSCTFTVKTVNGGVTDSITINPPVGG